MKKLLLTFALVVAFILSASAQNAISGVVKGSDNETIPGVSVFQKGTTYGTVTDINGKYSLSVEDNNAVLVFSFVGMLSQEIVTDGKSVINVSLESNAIGLDEFIAVGYGTMKKSDLTGAIASVNSSTIVEAKTSSVNEALQGLVAGVVVTSNSGAPGGDIKIRMRGANSINGGNDPLVVIDGFAGGSLKNLNPSDIASMEMLKDASATAIYGSRGANGVILVTTKMGKSGKAVVSYNGSFGVQQMYNKYDMLQTGDYAEIANERFLNTGGQAGKERYSADEIAYFKENGGTDWQDEVYRSAMMHNHDISISGGDEKNKYLVSTQYVDQQGILKSSNYDRLSYRANLDSKLTKKMSMGARIAGSLSSENPHALNNNGTITSDALTFEPTNTAYVGSDNIEYTQSNYVVVNNPVADYKELNHEVNSNQMSLNAFLKYDITSKINFKVSGGLRTTHGDSYRYSSVDLYSGIGTNGKAYISNYQRKTWQNTNQLTYNDQFGDHKLNVTLVNEQVASHYRSSNLTNTDFDTNLGYKDVSLGSSPQSPSSGFNDWALMSFLGRVNYSFRERYLFTASMRSDGSSKLANKWGYFPSASAAWRVTEESFMEDLDFINNMKLRASYGVTGSQSTSPYQSMAALKTGVNYAIDGSSIAVGVAPKRFDNPSLEWEKTYQYDLGIDLSLFDGKLHVTADYYDKLTKDLLLDAAVPLYSGFKTELKNIGEVKNSGVDLNLGTNLTFGKLNWSANFNASKNTSKILDLGGVDEMFFRVNGSNTTVLRVGESMGLLYGYVYDGVWKTSEEAEAAVYKMKPGDAKIRDIDDSKTINADDRQVIGCGLPEWVFGFSNSFSYGAWDLNFLFTSTIGNDIKNDVYGKAIGLESIDATHPDILNRWTPTNEDTDVPAFSSRQKTALQKESSRMIMDGSYLRLKNLTLGYTLDEKLTQSIKLASVRFYVSGQNLLTFTKYNGYDPEINSGKSDVQVGYDFSSYPTARVINCGVNVTF